MAAKKYFLLVHHESGRNDMLRGPRASKLRTALARGEGGVEVTQLVMAGYEGFSSPQREGGVCCFEALAPEDFGTYY